MSQTDQAIASLRSSIDALNAMVAGLQAQAAGKADASAVASLAIRVSSCERRIDVLGSSVTDQGTSVSALSNRITGEASARADADMELAQRIGSVQWDLSGAAASATCTLSSRRFSEGAAELHIKPEEAVEPLRMGKFVFHGETARQIRVAQTVLRQAGAGQLEVVKRANEQGEPFVVIDGQVFVSDAMVKGAVVDPDRFKVRLEVDEKGQYYAAGFGVGLKDSPYDKALDATGVLEYISGLVRKSQLGTELEKRLSLLEQSQEEKGGENRAVPDLLIGLVSRAEAITSMIQSEVGARIGADSALSGKIDALQAQVDYLQSKVYSGS